MTHSARQELMETVTRALLELPGELQEAEETWARGRSWLLTAEAGHDDSEASWQLAVGEDGKPLLNGGNAEARKAQLRDRLAVERDTVLQARREVLLLEATYNGIRRRLRAMEHLALLMAQPR